MIEAIANTALVVIVAFLTGYLIGHAIVAFMNRDRKNNG